MSRKAISKLGDGLDPNRAIDTWTILPKADLPFTGVLTFESYNLSESGDAFLEPSSK
jgi:hypothetical protein